MSSPAYECPVCHRPLMGPNETCGGSFTESAHPSAVKAVVVTQNPGDSEEDWPVVTVVRSVARGADIYYGPVNHLNADESKETYYPESSPNVLSVEEARAVADLLGHAGVPLSPLAQRLADYAKGAQS